MFEASVKVGVLVNPESNTMCIFAGELYSCLAREEERDLTVSTYASSGSLICGCCSRQCSACGSLWGWPY